MSGVLVTPRGARIEGQFASEEGVEGYAPGTSVPYASRRATPWRWDRGSPTKGMKVGWELRREGKTVSSYAFGINPQSLTRTETSRTQLFATRSKLYVDNFGAGAGSIQISQLVGSPKGHREDLIEGKPIGEPMTLREDVINFYYGIYLKAIAEGYGATPLEVWFYDNHLFHGAVNAQSVPERVWFPPNSFSLERAVNLQNVWRLSLAMQALRRPAAGVPGGSARANQTKVIVVKRNETVQQFARKIAGKNPPGKRVREVENKLLKLNPTIRRNRIADNKVIKAMHVVAGERVIVPA